MFYIFLCFNTFLPLPVSANYPPHAPTPLRLLLFISTGIAGSLRSGPARAPHRQFSILPAPFKTRDWVSAPPSFAFPGGNCRTPSLPSPGRLSGDRFPVRGSRRPSSATLASGERAPLLPGWPGPTHYPGRPAPARLRPRPPPPDWPPPSRPPVPLLPFAQWAPPPGAKIPPKEPRGSASTISGRAAGTAAAGRGAGRVGGGGSGGGRRRSKRCWRENF